MGFSRQEYWSGLRFPSPGDLPDQGSNLGLLHCRQILLPLSHQGSPVGKRCRRPWFNSWVGKIPWRRERLPTPVFLGFPCVSAGKESACNAGDLGSIPGLGRSPGQGKGYPLQYSCLQNPRGAWWAAVHGVAELDMTEAAERAHMRSPCLAPRGFSIAVHHT